MLFVCNAFTMLAFILISCSKEDTFEESRPPIKRNFNEINTLRNFFVEYNMLSNADVIFDNQKGQFKDKNSGVVQDIATLKTIYNMKIVDKEFIETTNTMYLIKKK